MITEAVSTQDWSGEAAVDVSIVNWVKDPPRPVGSFRLDGGAVAGITPALRAEGSDTSTAVRLGANRGRAFQGAIPVGAGFVLTAEQADALLGTEDADYRAVVRPYLIGDDIADDPAQAPRRWIIDFAFLALEEAASYPAALELVRTRVKPERERNRDAGFRDRWWRFGRPRGEMREAVLPLHRYIAGTATGKRILFCWQAVETCPSNLTNVFAFEDDYAMGVLCSRVHGVWAQAQSSTLEDRIRYTPTSAFETFPWPDPSAEQRERIASLSREIIARRQAICTERSIGLTTLYNEVDDGAYSELADLHRALDVAVAAAYAWPTSVAADPAESNRRLLDLNRRIAAGLLPYAPFGES